MILQVTLIRSPSTVDWGTGVGSVELFRGAPLGIGLTGSHVGIWPRGVATSLFGHSFESAGVCRTFLAWSQEWGLCLMVPSR